MKQRIPVGRWVGLGTLAGAMAVAGCNVPRSEDINTVQPGYVRKAIFQDGSDWHYRRTVVKSETVQSIITEGAGDIWIDRVTFEIQEDVLIARKPDQAVPGAGLDVLLSGNDDYRGVILAAWPITSHFDIIRDYNTLTGRETNRIVENTVDRPWYERDYMRVDFDNNLVDSSWFGSRAFGWNALLNWVATGDYWTNLETQPTDPYASRFSDDYIEITDNVMIGMDLLECAQFTGFSIWGYGNCGFGEAKMRHSFVKVDESNDYVPRFFPDSYVVQGPNGEPIEDPDTGEVVREPIFNRFGFYRFQTPVYDRGYGFTEEGRTFRATVFNIWETSRDENGDPLPYAERQEKPIIYYLNAEYPARYRETARRVEAEYDRVLREMVADLKGVPVDQIGTMFEIRDNDCRESNIIQTVVENPELYFAVERAVCAEDQVCNLGANLGNSAMSAQPGSEEMEALVTALQAEIGIGNLNTVCTSLEAASMDPQTGVPAFDWQRIGDLRHNMIVWIANPQRTGWGGYGPMHSDGQTGETLAGTSYLKGIAYERQAANVADWICFMNDEEGCSNVEVAYGQDIRRQTAATLQRALAMSDQRPSESSMQALRQRLSALRAGPNGGLPQDPTGNSVANRLRRIEGTAIEDAVITPEMVAALTEGQYMPDRDGPPGELREQFNLRYLVEEFDPFAPKRLQARKTLNEMGYCFLEADFDPHFAGMALDLKDMSREERFQIIADRMVAHVMLHELGHNFGLLHNFEASFDALNYNRRFWENINGTEEQQIQANIDEWRTSSVMDYLPSGKGAFSDFLAPYDIAAIRFGYGNQVQVFDSDAVDPNLQGGEDLAQWRYYNDYRKLPDHLCGGSCGSQEQAMDALTGRSWVDFDPQDPPRNEVPYLYCPDFFSRTTPFCATFDYGSSLSEIQANYYSMWKDYFFFNNFSRDRLVPIGWNLSQAFIPLFLHFDFMDVVSQHFQVRSMTDPNFQGTDLEADMAATLFNSMNTALEILATPTPNRYCAIENVGSLSRPLYLTWGNTAGCDPYKPVDELVDDGINAIDMPIGEARPLTLGLSRDFEERQWDWVGSFFDKLNTVLYIGLSRPRLLRFNYAVDQRNFFLSTYRLFEPEIRQLFENLFILDGFFIYPEAVQTFGNFWCRDPEAPGRSDFGYVEPRRMFDMSGDLESFPDASPNCLEPALLNPGFTRNIPDQAFVVAHAILSSNWDTRLDLGQQLKLWAVGAYDEPSHLTTFESCDTAPPNTNCFCSYQDVFTGVEYRALNFALEGEQSMPCALIEQANVSANRYEGNPSNVNQDILRLHVERLEFARELYRTFQDR